MGERIPIALEFSSSSPNKHKLNAANYDRSGRLPTEEFVVERDDVVDPYQDYFNIGVLGELAGGIRINPILEWKPYRIDLCLNDWFRFDHPGLYRLYLKSHRLTRQRAPDEAGDRTVHFAAVSNVLEIEILPRDPQWEDAKLAEIKATLRQPAPELPKPGGPPVPYDPRLVETLRLAQQELRILATPGAVRFALESAQRSGLSADPLILIGARDRADATAAFEHYLTDPQVGFHEADIRLRALFTLLAAKDAPKPLQLSPWAIPNDAAMQEIRATLLARQTGFQVIVREEAERLIPAVKRKDSASRKVSSEAIAAVARDAAQAAGLIPPEDYGLSRGQLIAQFLQFPSSQQDELLAKKWDLVRGPEMIPVLLNMLKKAEPSRLPQSMLSLQVWGLETGTAQAAMRRLSELSPQAASSFLRKDIASGNPHFAGFAVRMFPAQDIPEADTALAAKLKTDFAIALPLAAKFGTARLANQMRELQEEHMRSCADASAFIAYFVRTMPADGPGNGMDVLQRAMANREPRSCYRVMLLEQVAQIVWNPTIETEAIGLLNDPDIDMVSTAARVLAQHGSASVEPFLWKRLGRWSEKWKDRVAELEGNPITETGPAKERQLGSELSNAITSATSWMIDDPRRERLLSLCIDDSCRQQWGHDLFKGPFRVEASSGGEMFPPAFQVEGFTARTLEGLEAKLQQFPANATFCWGPETPNPFDAFSDGQRQQMFEEFAAFLSKRSMRIEPFSSEKCRQRAAAR
jgi:hypothetical protein